MAKDNKSKFQLDKGTEHKFDISKRSRRNFDLEKDEEDAVIAPVTTSAETVDTENTPQSSRKKWIWGVVGIAVLALVVWMLLSGGDKTSDGGKVDEVPVADNVDDSQKDDETFTSTDTPDLDNTDNISQEEVDETVSEEVVENENTPSAPTQTGTQRQQPSQGESVPAVPAAPAPRPTVSGDIETEARKVIRGDYGVGEERKAILGDKYSQIQSRVNELKRQGVF